MWYEEPAVVALAVTLAACAAVASFLNAPLRAVLTEYAGNRTRGRFWTAVSLAAMVLTPAGVVLFLAPLSEPTEPFRLAAVAHSLKWGMAGLIGSVVVLAGVLGVFARCHGSTIIIDSEQADDLNRILAKIRELRARELLDQLERR